MGAELVVTHLDHVGWRWLPPVVDRGEPLVAWAAPQPAMKAAAMATQVVLRVFATSLTRRADSQSGHVIDDAHRHVSIPMNPIARSGVFDHRESEAA